MGGEIASRSREWQGDDVMKKLIAFLGVLLFLAGAAAMIHPRVTFSSSQKEVEIDNHKVIFQSVRYTPIPRTLSGAVMLAGGVLIFLGVRRD